MNTRLKLLEAHMNYYVIQAQINIAEATISNNSVSIGIGVEPIGMIDHSSRDTDLAIDHKAMSIGRSMQIARNFIERYKEALADYEDELSSIEDNALDDEK